MQIPSSPRKTILLVEDHADSREMLRVLLESLLNYEVLSAENYEQAMDVAIFGQPNLILTDLGLPGTDGIELVRQLRKYDGRLRRVPIIMVTAFDSNQCYHSALAAGCNALLTKPIEF